MKPLTLVIGNKNYSSWSLRPWLFMRKNNFEFDQRLIALDAPNFRQDMAPYASYGTVPVLLDGDLQVWDSLAIIEYLIDSRGPQYSWPQNPADLALARSMAAEMHSGYGALRSQLPMDTRLKTAYQVTDASLQRDIDRVIKLWSQALSGSARAGNWLFGEFCAADAMLAPVVFRLSSYSIAVPETIQSYMDFVLADADIQAWCDAARDEVTLGQV